MLAGHTIDPIRAALIPCIPTVCGCPVFYIQASLRPALLEVIFDTNQAFNVNCVNGHKSCLFLLQACIPCMQLR